MKPTQPTSSVTSPATSTAAGARGSDSTDSPTRRRILVTGGFGNIGTTLAWGLADEYDLVALDLDDPDGDLPEAVEQVPGVDISQPGSLDGRLAGVDTVVHLAGNPSPEASWDDVLHANIIGTQVVLEAARQQGVRRVVLASSNHAMGMYDRDGEWPVYPHQLPRPDSFYGVSKVVGETLGRFYHEEFGLDVICLRIGWQSGDPMLASEDVLHAMWLSDADAVRLVRCSIEAEVTWGLYYGTSDNPNRRWDLTNTMLELGYRPEDSWTDLPGAEEQVVEGGEPAPEHWPSVD